ncbi:ecto-ADP-ribosyltransferase 5-like [Eucyclogobius newberryi]|uniref:ecto-ADP-ribosyltransferase 5-like n=1 Tax=Eucyclogobius newberryi TaxID=166745 RepID=UPI003B598261
MKTFVLTFGVCLFLTVTAAQEPVRSVELSMMDNAIDDRFYNCTEKTEEKVIQVYFPREIQTTPNFQEAWKKAETCAQKKLVTLQTKSNQLTLNHTRALCVYTANVPNLYDPLNSALRTGAVTYSTPAFQYHALYFWITTALQILREPCQTTYRRTNIVINGNKGDKIRFGQFASSSKHPNLSGFGSKTCFHIKTCLGVYIQKYSIYPEQEVLIPSFEMFEIVHVAYGSYEGLKCNKIFVLNHVTAPKQTKLNCKAANHNQPIRANVPLILIVLAFGWFAIESISNDKMRNI